MKNLALSRYKTTNGNIDIEAISAIDKLLYEEIFFNQDLFFDFLTISNLYKILELNIKEIFQSINDFEKRLIDEKVMILVDPDSEKLNINRCLLNYLFSFRAYVDHLETFIKRKFGKTSEQINDWTVLKNKIHKENFAYKFMYDLRNYAQHCGMPIDIFEILPSIDDNNYSVKINIGFDPVTLLQKFEWGNPLKSELKNKDVIMLIDVVNEFGILVKEFDSWFYKLIEPYLRDLNRKIESIIGDEDFKESNLCISFTNDQENLCIVDSVFRLMKQIDKNYE